MSAGICTQHDLSSGHEDGCRPRTSGQLELPSPGRLLLMVGWNLGESLGLPVVGYLVGAALSGQVAGMVAATVIVWLTALVRRLASGSVPGLLMISALVLTLQTSLVVGTGSGLVFLLQFPLANLVLCLLFARTAPTGKPLIGDLAAQVAELRLPSRPVPGLDKFFPGGYLALGRDFCRFSRRSGGPYGGRALHRGSPARHSHHRLRDRGGNTHINPVVHPGASPVRSSRQVRPGLTPGSHDQSGAHSVLPVATVHVDASADRGAVAVRNPEADGKQLRRAKAPGHAAGRPRLSPPTAAPSSDFCPSDRRDAGGGSDLRQSRRWSSRSDCSAGPGRTRRTGR